METQTFNDYAARRNATLTPAGIRLAAQLDAAHRIGGLLRSARRERQVTQTELAAIAGVTQADISRIERAQIIPTLPTLLRLLDAMNCELHVVTGATHPSRFLTSISK